MTDSKFSKTEQEVLDTILELLVDLEPESTEEVDAELRAAELDPQAMSSHIENIVQAALVKSPFNWRVQEREKIEQERHRYSLSKSQRKTASRVEAINRIQQLSTHYGVQFAGLHHRNLENASDEDLISLLNQLEFLADAQQEEE